MRLVSFFPVRRPRLLLGLADDISEDRGIVGDFFAGAFCGDAADFASIGGGETYASDREEAVSVAAVCQGGSEDGRVFQDGQSHTAEGGRARLQSVIEEGFFHFCGKVCSGIQRLAGSASPGSGGFQVLVEPSDVAGETLGTIEVV